VAFDFAQAERSEGVQAKDPTAVQAEPFGWLASQPLRINFAA
jgi:hypothetical protein